MKKIILFLILFILPFSVSAKTVDVYLFYGEECAYCHEEREFLDILERQYQDNINVYEYEVWHNTENSDLLSSVRDEMDDKGEGVPFTVIGDKSITGYTNNTASEIQKLINENLKENKTNIVKTVLSDEKIETTKNEEIILPIVGNVNVKEMPLFLQTILLSFADVISVNGLFIILFLMGILLVLKKHKNLFMIPFLLSLSVMYLLLILNVFSLSSTLQTITRTTIALIPIVIGAVILGKFMKKIENKEKNKLEIFIADHKKIFLSVSSITLGLIMGLSFYNAADAYPNILNIVMDINNGNVILYYILYILVFMLIIYLIVLLFDKLLYKILPNKYLGSFIILMIIGIVLVFLPNLFMFTS